VRRAALFSLCLALAACDRGAASRPPLGSGNGPDAILLRVPHAGGIAHAYRFGSDSAVWTSSSPVPALDRLLAFDDEAGSMAYVDTHGVPGRLDLRLGTPAPAGLYALSAMATDHGWAIYGLTSKHEVQRLTPSGSWSFQPSAEPAALVPLPDGTLILVSEQNGRSLLRRLRPPEQRVTDTASVPRAAQVITTELGDRVYFSGDSGLTGVRTRDLARVKTIKLGKTIVDAVATPSGDRIFVALAEKRSLTIVDRYAESVDGTIGLPDAPTALRMDPDGGYVLARNATGDSVRVIAIGTSRLIGTVASEWRVDLPLVAPDGGLALLQGNDVVVVDAETRKERQRILAGGADLWALLRWNGFRPRAAGLDEPVRFAADSVEPPVSADSVEAAIAGRVAQLPAEVPASAARVSDRQTVFAPPPVPPTAEGARPTTPVKQQWTLSFAALLAEDRAKTLAASIKVDGRAVRVVPGQRDGTTIYRVVYGPFGSRDEAEKAGKRTGLPFWVYEGAP
jgi:cell division septation protein DedD